MHSVSAQEIIGAVAYNAVYMGWIPILGMDVTFLRGRFFHFNEPEMAQ